MKLKYLDEIQPIIEKMDKQEDKIKEVSKLCAEIINSGKFVHLFGVGTSCLAVQDLFPRYGSILGFHPIMDPCLMLNSNVSASTNKALYILERTEGYISRVLDNQDLKEGEAIIIFSHSGANAVVIDAALYAKEKGLKVIAISSMDCFKYAPRTNHSKEKKLHEIADIVIDNCCPLEDAIVEVENNPSKVGATSTIGAILAGQSIMTETALELNKMGYKEYIFTSPTVEYCPKDWTDHCFEMNNRLHNK